MDRLLTVDDLADKWNYTKQTILKLIDEGKLKPCNIPGKKIQFTLSYIEGLENSGLVDKLSPVERMRLEREVSKLKQLNETKDKKIEELTQSIKNIYGQLGMFVSTLEIRN
jgi:hypothetical protein